MKEFSYLQNRENWEAACRASQIVLEQLRPQEASSALIEPLIEKAQKGGFVPIHKANQAGGLGGSDLMIVIIVPIIAAVVDDLLSRLGTATITEIRKRLKKEKELMAQIQVRVGDIEAIVKVIEYPAGEREVQALAQAVNAALLRILQES